VVTTALVGGLAAALLAAAPASAAVLDRTPNALPGSTFQGGDGNQQDTATLQDWQALEAARRVTHNPDPNERDSAFTGGSKEDMPGEWDLTVEDDGVRPGKANIRDAWSSVDQPGSNTFLYLGFARQSAIETRFGTTFLTFELNHDDRLWDNGRAEIPCRRTGDVLVSYEAQGDRANVVLQRWETSQTDAATGCATKGQLETFTGPMPDVDAQGALNANAITNYLPGSYGESIPTERFGEAALNLAELLAEAFEDECLAYSSVWMHSRSSISESSNMQDYVAPKRLDVRTCAASGTKFFDSNANGERDPGEIGIPRFRIWADYDNDGVRDPGEPSAVSDRQGEYVIHDIRPPDGTYWLREKLLTRRSRLVAVSNDWVCSYPNDGTPGGTGSAPGGRFPCGWGPINAEANPNVQGKDFGNWFPAQLTVSKRLSPAGDPGLFDFALDGDVVLTGGGDGASVTINPLDPGTYDVSESASLGTDLANYRSSVRCRVRPSGQGERRPGPVFTGLTINRGQRAICTFINIRMGMGPVPAIEIVKVGPGIAEAGDRLRYTLYVTNPGDVAFPESAVRVTDPRCDAPPELDERRRDSGADPSPETLDPGETWVYHCSYRTPAPGADCEPGRVPNTGTVTVDGTTLQDSDSIETILLCPDQPPPPIPEPLPGPDPDGAGPVVPPGPPPPNAGAAARAGLIFERAIAGCIRSRVPLVDLRGTNIRRVRVSVNGRLIRGLTVRTLQARLRPRVTLAPGRYRIRVRVAFTRGSGSPSVTFAGRIRICAAQAPPPVTG
jgi:hypothetical protein